MFSLKSIRRCFKHDDRIEYEVKKSLNEKM